MPMILLVEDEANDVLLARRAFSKAGVLADMRVAADGSAAEAYLSGAGEFEDRRRHPLPDLVLLDLKLPLKNGLEILAWMRSVPALARIPVVCLTSSCEPQDVARAYALGCAAYYVKPAAFPDLVERARAVGRSLGALHDAGPGLSDFSEPPPAS